MTNPATVDDVSARYPGDLTAAEQQRAQALLDDAWEEVLARVPGVETRLGTGDLRSGVVVKVLCQAVVSVLQNPGGYSSESIDDWTGRRDSSGATGRVMFSDDDLLPLFGYVTSVGAFEITLAGDIP